MPLDDDETEAGIDMFASIVCKKDKTMEDEVCVYCGRESHVIGEYYSTDCNNCGEMMGGNENICHNCGYPHCFTRKE